MSDEKPDGSWLLDLVETFAPDDPVPDGTSDGMTKKAGWLAFQISTVAAIPPGPVGLLTILPEVLAVTKVQINLIYKIAAYFKKQTILRDNPRLIIIILANALGVSIGKSLVAHYGEVLVLRAIESAMLKKVTQKVGQGIGAKIVARITSKGVLRFVPVVLAPLFGQLSRSMTIKIGKEADKIFGGDIVIEQVKTCKNGHEAQPEANFCPICGSPFQIDSVPE